MMTDPTLNIALSIDSLSMRCPSRVLLDNASACLHTGQLTALIGRNGTGKSTLLSILAGLNKAYQGNITIQGHDIRTLSRAQLAHNVSFVNTRRVRISNMTCRDIVALGRSPYTGWSGRASASDMQVVDNAMELTSTSAFSTRYIDTLSDGEYQRVMIARALAQDTPLMLLDEPTSFLDIPARHDTVRLLSSLSHDTGKTILFSTHELDIATRYCDTLLLIADTTLHTLPASTALSSPLLSHAFSL